DPTKAGTCQRLDLFGRTPEPGEVPCDDVLAVEHPALAEASNQVACEGGRRAPGDRWPKVTPIRVNASSAERDTQRIPDREPDQAADSSVLQPHQGPQPTHTRSVHSLMWLGILAQCAYDPQHPNGALPGRDPCVDLAVAARRCCNSRPHPVSARRYTSGRTQD